MDVIIQKLVADIENYPEDWTDICGRLTNNSLGLSVIYGDYKSTVQQGSIEVYYYGKKRRVLNRAVLRWITWYERKIQASNKEKIRKVLGLNSSDRLSSFVRPESNG